MPAARMLRLCLLGYAMMAGMALADDSAAPPRLIVRGDDMGFSHSGNEALIQCYTSGIETSIEVLVPSPWFPEAVKMLEQHPGVDVGVHLTLTSEWDNMKWRPLTDSPGLKDADGFLYPMVRPNANYPGRAVLENKWTIDEVEREFRAQIELAKARIPRISHLSGHMGCTNMTPEITALSRKLAAEYDLLFDLEDFNVKSMRQGQKAQTQAGRIQSFIDGLEKLEPGQTYLFVEHPGLDTPELRAIHHIGYEDVAEDRQLVTDVWTSPLVREAIKARGIQLIGYDDLVK